MSGADLDRQVRELWCAVEALTSVVLPPGVTVGAPPAYGERWGVCVRSMGGSMLFWHAATLREALEAAGVSCAATRTNSILVTDGVTCDARTFELLALFPAWALWRPDFLAVYELLLAMPPLLMVSRACALLDDGEREREREGAS